MVDVTETEKRVLHVGERTDVHLPRTRRSALRAHAFIYAAC